MEAFDVTKKEAILSPPFLLLLGPCVSDRTKDTPLVRIIHCVLKCFVIFSPRIMNQDLIISSFPHELQHYLRKKHL